MRESLSEHNNGRAILDVGCGRNKTPGAVGLDRHAIPGVDVVHDLDTIPYPFEPDSFDEIHANHVIEHVAAIETFLGELHRVGRPGAKVYIRTPHYSYSGSWHDPTHRWHLSTASFDYFAEAHPAAHYTGTSRFRLVSVEVSLLNPWRTIGVQWLVNAVNKHRRWRAFRKTWEEHLSFILRGREIRAILEVMK
jgi:predicted SAM-dependent methyltransferase